MNRLVLLSLLAIVPLAGCRVAAGNGSATAGVPDEAARALIRYFLRESAVETAGRLVSKEILEGTLGTSTRKLIEDEARVAAELAARKALAEQAAREAGGVLARSPAQASAVSMDRYLATDALLSRLKGMDRVIREAASSSSVIDDVFRQVSRPTNFPVDPEETIIGTFTDLRGLFAPRVGSPLSAEASALISAQSEQGLVNGLEALTRPRPISNAEAETIRRAFDMGHFVPAVQTRVIAVPAGEEAKTATLSSIAPQLRRLDSLADVANHPGRVLAVRLTTVPGGGAPVTRTVRYYAVIGPSGEALVHDMLTSSLISYAEMSLRAEARQAASAALTKAAAGGIFPKAFKAPLVGAAARAATSSPSSGAAEEKK